MSDTTILTPSLRSRLDAVARRIRRLRLIRGLSFLALILLLSAAAAMVVDYLIPLPGFLRLALFGGWVTVGAATCLFGVVLPLRRRFNSADLAAVIEQKYPELAERLTTTVELAESSGELHGSQALLALLVSDTAQRTARLDFLPAISARGALVGGLAALTLFALAVSPAVVWTREYRQQGQRFFLAWQTPKQEIPYDLDVLTKDVLTARGRPALFTAQLVPHHSTVALPTSSTLVLIDENGKKTRLPMVAACQDMFHLEHKITHDGKYRIEAGAAVSPTYDIRTIIPVELADDSPSVTITPPVYARQSVGEQHLTGLLDLSALKHSEVSFDFRFTRPAVAAFVEWTALETEQKTRMLPLTLSEDRRSAKWSMPAVANASYRVVLEAEQGIRTELEPKTLTVRIDQPPQLVRFAGKEELKVVLPYERLPLEITVGDDIGVARADLEFRINDGKARTEALRLSGINLQEASARYDFHLAGKVKEGDEISYRLRVQDNLPGEYGGPQTVYYPADRWLKFKVAQQTTPLRQQEIIAQREDINKRIDALKADLLREQRGVYKSRQETRSDSRLAPDQAVNINQLQQDNRAAESELRALAREADANQALEQLARLAENLADQEMRQSESALRNAAQQAEAALRDTEFQKADKVLTEALQKLEELKKANDKLAQDRLDQQQVETLAEREKQLAQQARDLAEADPGRDSKAQQQLQQLQREQAEVAAELQRLREQSETLRSALDAAHAEEAKQLSNRAQELADAQRELAQAMKETNEQNQAERPAELALKQEKQLAELLKQQEELAKQTAELAKNVRQDQGEKASTTHQAQQVRQTTRQAANKMQAGAFPAALQAGKESAESLRKLAQDLAQTPRGKSEPSIPDPVQQARRLAQKQEELNRLLEPLTKENALRRAQQQTRQQDLEKQANQLTQELKELGQQMTRSPEASNLAKQASNSTQQARDQMRAANEQRQKGKKPVADQAQQNAIFALEQGAKQAAQASQLAGNMAPAAAQPTGQAVQEASKQLGQAQNQLTQGQAQGAQATMRQATQSLQRAAQQMAAQQRGQSEKPSRPGAGGAASGGRPDPSILGPEAQQYAGKTWGELPGELRTKIVQDMKAKYGDDYSRMIQLYFEQLADTKK